jgi:hypothetical protein
MKKLVTLIMVFVLTLTLSSCDNPPNSDTHSFCDYYTDKTLEECVEEEINDYLDRNNDNYYTKEEVDEFLKERHDRHELLIDELDDYIDELEDRLDDIESIKTYNREQIELIIYAYEIQKSIALIEDNALDEGRELTNEELLLIASYEILLNQVDIE